MRHIVDINSGRSHVEHDPVCGFFWGLPCDCYPRFSFYPYILGLIFWAVLIGLCWHYHQKAPAPAPAKPLSSIVSPDVYIGVDMGRWHEMYVSDQVPCGQMTHSQRCTGKL